MIFERHLWISVTIKSGGLGEEPGWNMCLCQFWLQLRVSLLHYSSVNIVFNVEFRRFASKSMVRLT